MSAKGVQINNAIQSKTPPPVGQIDLGHLKPGNKPVFDNNTPDAWGRGKAPYFSSPPLGVLVTPNPSLTATARGPAGLNWISLFFVASHCKEGENGTAPK